jgi:NodT family efflux transporter outer membrane factor (OMF) lipoprotein
MRRRSVTVPASPGSVLTAVLTAVLAAVLAGCAVGPNFRSPGPPDNGRFTEAPLPAQTRSAATAGGNAQRLEAGRDIPGDWWTVFHSPQITALVTRALRANPDIAAAQSTLRQANENRRAEQGAFFPQVTANGSAQRSRETLAAFGFAGSGSALGGLGSGGGFDYTLYGASLNVSYTIDAFGGTRRQVEQLGAQSDYQRYELEATYLTLAANVITTAITEASLQSQIDTTKDIIKADTEALTLTQQRFQAGGVSQADVLQQQSLLDAQVATLPNLEKQRQQARNQLAVYVGGRPDQYDAATLELNHLTLPADLPVSLPSRLVEQRPDIKAYEALLHAATAQVGVATANMLPQLTLTGSYGYQGSSISNLFTPTGIVWTIAGAIAQPIFEGGTLAARREAAKAALDTAAAQYSSTVNNAFQNVANALVAIERDAETLQAALAAQKTAAASLAVVRSQYTSGAAPYLNVLTAEQSDYSARLNLIAARAARFTDTVALYQALGGGWWNRNDVDPKVAKSGGLIP